MGCGFDPVQGEDAGRAIRGGYLIFKRNDNFAPSSLRAPLQKYKSIMGAPLDHHWPLPCRLSSQPFIMFGGL